MKSMQNLNLILKNSYSDPPPAPPYPDKNHRDKEGSFVDSGMFFLFANLKSLLIAEVRAIGRDLGWVHIDRRRNLFKTFFTAALFLQPVFLSAQDLSQTITKTAEFADISDAGNKFRIMNINGSVTIEAYDGETIELTVTEQIEGTSSEIEQAKEELEYKLERRRNLVLAWLDAPFVTLKYEEDKIHYRINRDDDDYRFTHEVRVRVPQDILVEGSTINKGILSITGVFKKVEASNINGDLELKNVASQTFAFTVNGDITISYEKAPNRNSKYQTVNGTINISMPEDLSADIYFKSMHGDFYTDFKNIQRLKPEVQKDKQSSHSSVTYRLGKFSPIRIGSGGVDLRFEVLNGDVYLRKRQGNDFLNK